MFHAARNQDHDDGREVDDINRQTKNANKTPCFARSQFSHKKFTMQFD